MGSAGIKTLQEEIHLDEGGLHAWSPSENIHDYNMLQYVGEPFVADAVAAISNGVGSVLKRPDRKGGEAQEAVAIYLEQYSIQC